MGLTIKDKKTILKQILTYELDEELKKLINSYNIICMLEAKKEVFDDFEKQFKEDVYYKLGRYVGMWISNYEKLKKKHS